MAKGKRNLETKELESFLSYQLPEWMEVAIEIAASTGVRLNKILLLTWAHILPSSVLFRRNQSDAAVLIQLTARLKATMVKSRRIPTGFARLHLVRLEDGAPLNEKEFNTIWKVYMSRWASKGQNRIPFSFDDISNMALADSRKETNTSQRRGHRVLR
jgi:integrase